VGKGVSTLVGRTVVDLQGEDFLQNQDEFFS